MIYAQGDILIEQVNDNARGATIAPDSDGSVVLGRGEVTGHRHRFALEDRVTMFRDDAKARDVSPELYIGHIRVGADGATLLHEEHAPVSLKQGVYRIRRQREFTVEAVRVVAD